MPSIGQYVKSALYSAGSVAVGLSMSADLLAADSAKVRAIFDRLSPDKKLELNIGEQNARIYREIKKGANQLVIEYYTSEGEIEKRFRLISNVPPQGQRLDVQPQRVEVNAGAPITRLEDLMKGPDLSPQLTKDAIRVMFDITIEAAYNSLQKSIP